MFETQIAKGVALLDERMPGWLDRIDTDRLDMDMPFGPCGCVLAQIDHQHASYGSYDICRASLGLDIDGAAGHGFAVVGDYSPSKGDRLYAALTDEWKATILRLRAERSTSPALR
jgi:uncharacterized protein YfaP (DUF2135 family)